MASITITIDGFEDLLTPEKAEKILSSFSRTTGTVNNFANCVFNESCNGNCNGKSLKDRISDGDPVDVREVFAAKQQDNADCILVSRKKLQELVDMLRHYLDALQRQREAEENVELQKEALQTAQEALDDAKVNGWAGIADAEGTLRSILEQ